MVSESVLDVGMSLDELGNALPNGEAKQQSLP